MKILNLIGEFSEEAKPFLEAVGEVDYRTLTQEELMGAVAPYEAWVVRLGLFFTKEVIDAAPNLRYIATASTGLNHIDVEYAKSKGIEVVSLRGENEFLDSITSTAELAFGMLIDLMRYIPWAFDSIRRYELKLEEFKGRSLSGKTLGIVGMGRLGKIIAAGAAGWRMNVVFADPNVPQEKFPQYKKLSLEELLAQSDAVTLHLHLLPETQGLIGKQQLALMKRGAYLVNTSRGEIVDEAAVLKALEKGQLGGYATDVLAGEMALIKKFENHPLVEYAKGHRNCLIVPHTGGLTSDSRVATDVFIAQKLATAIRSSTT